MSVKISKTKEYKKKGLPTFCNARLRSTLPVLIKLQDIEKIHPTEVIDLLTYLISPSSITLLDNVEKGKLIKYLAKWGLDSSWVTE